MKILLLGSGGRENAIAWKLSQSKLVKLLYIAPGNPGTARIGLNLPVSPTDFNAVKELVRKYKFNMVIVGPEDPLVHGIHDFFLTDKELSGITVIGPVQKGAMLEGSKDFAKQFMNRHDIPTAAYKTFTKETMSDGLEFIRDSKAPYVLKADGLAAGKGVVICQTAGEAEVELQSMLTDARFGEASKKVVIEEFMEGIELSVFVITDGKSYKILPEAKDYKRIGEGDSGPNTGGMGSVSPVSFADKKFMDEVEKTIIRPTMDGLIAEGIDYRGFLFFGLIKVGEKPFVIEYNCRLGDPETESLLPRLKNDLGELLLAVGTQQLAQTEILVDPGYAATVMLVSKGYPGPYEKGKRIDGLRQVEDSFVFHAGTAVDKATRKYVTNGGRVLAVTSVGKTMKEALQKCYANAEKIEFEGKNYRKDIGFDL